MASVVLYIAWSILQYDKKLPGYPVVCLKLNSMLLITKATFRSLHHFYSDLHLHLFLLWQIADNGRMCLLY
jgi:hypothetical protein